MAAVDEFLRTLQKSELIGLDRATRLLAEIPADDRADARKLADRLIAAEALTPFRAQKLLDGIWIGLKLGPYVIRSPIARGGMGTVYFAVDSRSNRPVAIKVMLPQRAKEGQRHLLRFRRKMNLTQKLQHPNIAEALDFGLENGVHFLVLEFIPGQTLNKIVQQSGPLSVDRAARIFVDVAEGLIHAHGEGLIHRDLKPSNIMVLPGGRGKILDLGLALLHGETSEDIEVLGGKGYLVGSIDYMAPEQTRDPTKVDARADVYSLGCSLYFALSGKAPFAETPQKEKVRAQRLAMPESLLRRNPLIPDAFVRIVERLMAKKPEDRPKSAAEVRDLLLPWLQEGAPSAEPLIRPFDLAIGDASLYRQDTLSQAFSGLQTSSDSLTSLDNVRQMLEDDAAMKQWVLRGLGLAGVVIATAVFVFGLIALLRR